MSEMPHTHDADGSVVIAPIDPPPQPVDPQGAAEAAGAAEVRVAEIQAERDLALAKLQLKSDEMWQESRVAELEAELRAVKDTLAAMQPAAPEPVVIAADPEPEPEAVPAPAPAEQPAEPEQEQPKKSKGFFGDAYR